MKGTESKTGIEAAREAKELFDKFKPDLKITDVPIKALNQFKKLANEEFKAKGSAAHYGFTLKHLIDFYYGKITEQSQIALSTAEEAIARIEKLEQSAVGTEEKNPKIKKMMDGSEMRCF